MVYVECIECVKLTLYLFPNFSYDQNLYFTMHNKLCSFMKRNEVVFSTIQ